MKATSLAWSPAGWTPAPSHWPAHASLVLYFGASDLLADPAGPVSELLRRFPDALCAGCSTAGEINGPTVREGSLSVLCIEFNHTQVRAAAVTVTESAASFAAAQALAARLAGPELRHLLVLSDGLGVNGTSLAAGFRSALPGVTVTGGLAGDGTSFRRTLVGLGAEIARNRIVGIGFYGSHLQVACGSAGGWTPFGPVRCITQSAGNVLYRLDDQPALELYKRYLGDRAAGLPSTGLLFPLSLLPNREAECGLVRTILAVDEEAQSLTFAGDIPEGSYVRLMKASYDALIESAESAARTALDAVPLSAAFVVLVSCVGRKLVLGQRVEEELENALALFGPNTPAAGFYSYGEICPSGQPRRCDLHNQTMTLTAFAESD